MSAPRPVRLRLQRAARYSLQDASRAINGRPARKVDRSTAFGNPYPICRGRTAQQSVAAFRRHAESTPALREMAIRQLRGLNLACWCALDAPCHADILLEIANG